MTAPDGRTWQGPSPLRTVAIEQSERVPPEIALQRVFAVCDESEEFLPEHLLLAKFYSVTNQDDLISAMAKQIARLQYKVQGLTPPFSFAPQRVRG